MPLALAALIFLAPITVPDCADPKTNIGRFQIERGEARSCDEPIIPDRPVSPDLQAKVRTYFDNALRDGPSARWRWEKLKGGKVVCGYVNAKNALGAYSGWSPFVFVVADETGSVFDERDAWIFETVCHDAPVPQR